ncbi:MAG: OmpA family protein, partial [Thermoanaerobaculia bacterium]|nr:OmpA family protein [Thermoanaerobaculia bacterium]
LEDLVGRYSRRLAEFEGDTAPFEGCDVLLEPCLVSRFSESRPQRRGLVRVVWGVVMAGLVALLAWWIVAAIDGRRWRRAVASLDAEPGIVVTADRREGGRRVVTGLRDPYSRVPSDVLAEAGVDVSRVDFALEPYQSLEDAVLAARLRAAWAVPATVESLAVDDGVVTVTGEADAAWLAAARRNGAALGITGWRLEGLAITEDLALRREIEALESVRFLMILDSTRLVAESEARIDEVAERLARAAELAATLGEELDVVVSGHTDESGSESRNVRLSERRAQTVVDLLVARGLDPGLFSILGVGTAEYLEAEGDVDEAQLNRRVSLLIERRPAGSGVDMIGGPEVAN